MRTNIITLWGIYDCLHELADCFTQFREMKENGTSPESPEYKETLESMTLYLEQLGRHCQLSAPAVVDRLQRWTPADQTGLAPNNLLGKFLTEREM